MFENGYNIDKINNLLNTGSTLLIRTIENNNLHAVKLLLKHGANINIKNQDGKTPLDIAKLKNNKKMIKLIESLFNVNKKNQQEQTPLFNAVQLNDKLYIDILLKYGADVNAEDKYSLTPIVFAQTVDILKLLIDNGANIEHVTNKGLFPIWFFIMKNANDLATYMFDNGYNIDKINNLLSTGSTLLIKTIKKNNLHIAKLLLKYGADINIKNKDGKTPLDIAKLKNNNEMIELIESLLNVNKKDQLGETPLFNAVRSNDKLYIDILLKYGADINAVNIMGLTPIFNVKTRDILELLIQNGANIEHVQNKGLFPLFFFIMKSQPALVTYMFKNGYNIDKINNLLDRDSTLLILIINKNDLYTVKLLLKHGVDKQKVLDIAKQTNNKEIIELLNNYNQDGGFVNYKYKYNKYKIKYMEYKNKLTHC